MVLGKLGDSLKSSLQKLANSVFVNDTALNELIKDIQRSLLQSDVNVKLVFSLTNAIKDRAKNEKTPSGLTKKEHIVHIVYEELTQFLGGEFVPITLDTEKKPFTIMLVGLFGNGKTTTIGKLAKYYTKRGFKVAAIQTDTWRPAAYEQLKTNASLANADFFGEVPDKKRRGDISYSKEIFEKHKKELKKYDIVLVDTAGRDALSSDLVEELKELNSVVEANETLLVIGADVGQTAESQAKSFHESCDITGVIISKMDGTAKGGGALSACSITKTNVKFIGTGEKIDDFEEFKPKNFVSRLLGMGDLESLLEKAKDAMSGKDSEEMGKKLLSGNFTLTDLYDQMMAMKKMGPLTKVMDLIPGMGGLNIPKEALKEQEKKLEAWKYIMDSCTKFELENPDEISQSRIQRVAAGSGRTEREIRDMLKQYKQSKKMMKMMKGGGSGNPKQMQKMMKRMGGLKGMGMPKF